MGLECKFTEKVPWSRERRGSETTSTSDAVSQSSQQQPSAMLPVQAEPCIINRCSTSSTEILKQPVSNSNDALDILFKTARFDSGSSMSTISGCEMLQQKTLVEVPDPEAIRIWNACRFVKMGWFSASEAIDLVNLSVPEGANTFR